MNRLLMAAALIVLAACGGVSTQNGNGTDKEGLNGKVLSANLDLQREVPGQ